MQWMMEEENNEDPSDLELYCHWGLEKKNESYGFKFYV